MPSADLRRAIALLKSGEYTCVLAKGERIYTSRERGVAPMLGYLAEHLNLQGFAVADRIVGRAAAMLFVLAGIEEAYGEVMSKGAAEYLRQRGIGASFGVETERIINRAGNGSCPMEAAVAGIDDPVAGYDAIRKQRETFRRAANGRENWHDHCTGEQGV